MTRNRATAKAAGARFERMIADGLAEALEDTRIDRKVKTGSKDKGDIANVRLGEHKIVIECKDRGGQFFAAEWVAEAEAERVNDDHALAGIVIAKRKGVTDPLQQYVVMTVGDLVALIRGDRKHMEGKE
ncbi:MAG TPA: hypothetical protein VJ617_12130 [Arthrobacter sp.]|nr:hypothetical protein [Arthrobacter sp.]